MKSKCENYKHSKGTHLILQTLTQKWKHKPLPHYPSPVTAPLLKHNALFNKLPNEHNNQVRAKKLQEAIKTKDHKMPPKTSGLEGRS